MCGSIRRLEMDDGLTVKTEIRTSRHFSRLPTNRALRVFRAASQSPRKSEGRYRRIGRNNLDVHKTNAAFYQFE